MGLISKRLKAKRFLARRLKAKSDAGVHGSKAHTPKSFFRVRF
jgi:hypothetical protein